MPGYLQAPFVKFQAMAFRKLSIIRKVSYIAYVEKDEKGFIEQWLVVVLVEMFVDTRVQFQVLRMTLLPLDIFRQTL